MSLDLKSNTHQNNLKDVNQSDSAIWEFEDFRLDAEHLMLYRGGEEISLTPKQVETLLALVERHGEIVSKDALMERLWGNAFVEESNLVQNVYILRKVLGSTNNGKPIIETLRRRGYRFNGGLRISEGVRLEDVREQHRKGEDRLLRIPTLVIKDEPVFEKPVAPASSGKTWTIGAGAVLLLVAIGFGIYFLALPKTTVGKKSIAVLPVHPIDATTRDEIYEIGIADSLIHRLGSMKGLVVRPLSATRKYADIEQDPIAAGKQEQVDYVLASNYQMAGGKIRITSELFDVATGQIEETYKSEKDAGDVFQMQDAIAGEVGKLLQSRFVVTSGTPAENHGTKSEEAYRLYLQAMYLVDKEKPADSKRAIELFDEALALDPNYAKAWANKARAHCHYAHTGGGSPDAEYAQARPALQRAFALDNNLAEAHAVLAIIKIDYDWDFAEGERQFRQAIELSPNTDIFYRWYAYRLANQGRSDEAIAMAKTAIDLNPNYIVNHINYGRVLYYARRYDEAIAQFNRVIEMDSSQPNAYILLSLCFHQKRDYSQAYEAFIKYQRLSGTKDDALKTYESLYTKRGWQSVLLKLMEIVKTSDANDSKAHTIAWLAALTGNQEESLRYLDRAVKNRSLEFPSIPGDPRFDSLRGDPRFDNLLRRVASK